MSQEKAKERASLKALEFVEDGMLIGLGTGSTATFFIQYLIEKCQKGLQVQAVATSIASEKMAKNGGISLANINVITSLDLTIDGADEIDAKKRLIKGAGGALLREKIIATMSKKMIVIADETKLVKNLGKHPLPVEIIPFGLEATKKHLLNKGFQGTWRKNKDDSFYFTDNGNHILDIQLPSMNDFPEKIHAELIDIPGVVGTGFFFHPAPTLIIGRENGTVEIKT